MKKIARVLLIGALCVGLLAGCGGNNADGLVGNTGKDAIKVNETMIKSDYVERRMDQLFKINNLNAEDAYSDYYRASVVSGLVNNVLLMQEAERREITASDDEIQSLYDETVQSYGSEENFKTIMEDYGINDEDFKEMVREQVIYDKISEDLTKDLEVDAQAYYDENTSEFEVEDQVKASHILVKTEEEANTILEELEGGADFAELAAEHSEDLSNANDGGQLGFFTANQPVPQFSEAAFSMEPGEISEAPVETDYGYHIIKVEEKQAAHLQTFEEVEEEINTFLKNQEVSTKMQELMQQLRNDAEIEYVMDEYNPEKLMEKVQESMQQQQPVVEEQPAEGETTVVAEEEAPAEEGTTDEGQVTEEGVVMIEEAPEE